MIAVTWTGPKPILDLNAGQRSGPMQSSTARWKCSNMKCDSYCRRFVWRLLLDLRYGCRIRNWCDRRRNSLCLYVWTAVHTHKRILKLSHTSWRYGWRPKLWSTSTSPVSGAVIPNWRKSLAWCSTYWGAERVRIWGVILYIGQSSGCTWIISMCIPCGVPEWLSIVTD